eukprot:gene19061-biopygen5908
MMQRRLLLSAAVAAPVVLSGCASQNLDGYARVIGAGHPQTQNFRAHFVGNLLGRNDIAHRLAHLAALAINHEPVGEQGFVWRHAVDHAAGQQ